jgi:cyclopropane fatty-acyl-phospholipid synthase-like methyltransferase
MTQKDPDWLHKEYPKTCAPNDFWGQVKRTVKGKPVAQDQIDMIVKAIRAGLQFEESDILLDLGCGNGALSQHFFPSCSRMLGVDFSSYLIAVAKTNFEQPPTYVFLEEDIAAYVSNEQYPLRFTKALCYGAFSYLSHKNARTLLQILSDRFNNIKAFFIGNLPDKEKVGDFYPPDTDYCALVDDNTSPIGIWRSKEDMYQLARETNWVAEFMTMPTSFYAAYYRYDVILRPNN